MRRVPDDDDVCDSLCRIFGTQRHSLPNALGFAAMTFGKLTVAILLLSSGCVQRSVTPLGKNEYPPKPTGCEIQLFPGATDYPVEDLATVRMDCHAFVGRDGCIKELKDEACKLGGDTLYDLKDGGTNPLVVIGRVALRTGDAPPPKAECDPICSPGYKCNKSGTCVPVCNPPCEAGEKCGMDRVCHPKSPPPAASDAPTP